jgi:Polyketide cyclase / dehydrase and lipid transport
VRAWDGAVPSSVPDGYPAPGQHARWRTAIGPLPVVLHDRVRAVEPPTRLAARITYAFVDLDEEYVLERDGDATLVTSANDVRSRLPGLGWLATRHTRRAVRDAMARLATHCARG